MSHAEPPPKAARRRWSPAIARLVARLLLSANVLTAILLGVVSLLIALSAFEASRFSDDANYNDSVANRISTDAINQAQEDLAEHVSDTQVWVQIAASGLSIDESPLTPLLSQRWLDAARRSEAQGRGTDILPTDQRYFDELHVDSQAYAHQIKVRFDTARRAGSISSRLTGSSVIYSAALLLLTVASTTARRSAKLALNTVAAVIIAVAVVIGFAPIQ